jgi:hypothetical protein
MYEKNQNNIRRISTDLLLGQESFKRTTKFHQL